MGKQAICLSENYWLIQHNTDFYIKSKNHHLSNKSTELKYSAFAELQQFEWKRDES